MQARRQVTVRQGWRDRERKEQINRKSFISDTSNPYRISRMVRTLIFALNLEMNSRLNAMLLIQQTKIQSLI